jgi:hypothetical protein
MARQKNNLRRVSDVMSVCDSSYCSIYFYNIFTHLIPAPRKDYRLTCLVTRFCLQLLLSINKGDSARLERLLSEQ